MYPFEFKWAHIFIPIKCRERKKREQSFVWLDYWEGLSHILQIPKTISQSIPLWADERQGEISCSEESLSCSEVHWIYTAVKTQRREWGHCYDLCQPHVCMHTHAHMRTLRVCFPIADIQGQGWQGTRTMYWTQLCAGLNWETLGRIICLDF